MFLEEYLNHVLLTGKHSHGLRVASHGLPVTMAGGDKIGNPARGMGTMVGLSKNKRRAQLHSIPRGAAKDLKAIRGIGDNGAL